MQYMFSDCLHFLAGFKGKFKSAREYILECVYEIHRERGRERRRDGRFGDREKNRVQAQLMKTIKSESKGTCYLLLHYA